MHRRTIEASLAVEVAVSTLIVAAFAIPLMSLLFQERETEQLSRYQYVALVAARDEMYQSRMAVAAGATADSIAHGFEELTGSPLGRIEPMAPGVTLPVTYHKEQSRIETQLVLEPDTGGRIRLATVEARWIDPANQGNGSGGRPSSLKIVFGLLTPP